MVDEVWSLKAGDKYQGKEIRSIAHTEANLCVIEFVDGEQVAAYRNNTENEEIVLAMHSDLSHEYGTIMKGVKSKNFYRTLIYDLINAFQYVKRREGKRLENEELERLFANSNSFLEENGPIEIVSSGSKFCTYFNKADELCLERNGLKETDRINKIIDEFAKLKNIILNSFDSKEEIKKLNRSLGTELVRELSKVRSSQGRKLLENTWELICNKGQAEIRKVYVVFGFSTSALISLILVVIMYFNPQSVLYDIIIGGIGGVIGTLLSLLQRANAVSFSPYIPLTDVQQQIFIRVMLGLLCGGLVIVLSNANVLFGLVKDNVYGLFVFCVIAGLSERFIPDALSTVQNNIKHS